MNVEKLKAKEISDHIWASDFADFMVALCTDFMLHPKSAKITGTYVTPDKETPGVYYDAIGMQSHGLEDMVMEFSIESDEPTPSAVVTMTDRRTGEAMLRWTFSVPNGTEDDPNINMAVGTHHYSVYLMRECDVATPIIKAIAMFADLMGVVDKLVFGVVSQYEYKMVSWLRENGWSLVFYNDLFMVVKPIKDIIQPPLFDLTLRCAGDCEECLTCDAGV